jgi:hypothetical protein
MNTGNNPQQPKPSTGAGEEQPQPTIAELQSEIVELKRKQMAFEGALAAMKEELRLTVVAVRSHQTQLNSQGL